MGFEEDGTAQQGKKHASGMFFSPGENPIGGRAQSVRTVNCYRSWYVAASATLFFIWAFVGGMGFEETDPCLQGIKSVRWTLFKAGGESHHPPHEKTVDFCRRFFNDVCLLANDVGCASDVYFVNDVASLMFFGKHCFIATTRATS